MRSPWTLAAAAAVAVVAVLVATAALGGVRAQTDEPPGPPPEIPDPPYTPVHAPGYCVWYKECGTSNDPRIPGRLNCNYNGPAIPVRCPFRAAPRGLERC